MANFLVVICENRGSKDFNSVIECMGELGKYKCISKNLYILSCMSSLDSEYVCNHLMLKANSDILVVKLFSETDINWHFKLRKDIIDEDLNKLLGRI